MNLKEKLLNALDAALASPKPEPRIALGKLIIDRTPEAGPTPDEMAHLRSLEKDWTSAYNARLRYTPDAAGQDWYKHVTEHADHVATGKIAELRTRGFESLKSEYEAKSEAARITQSRAAGQAWQIAKGAIQRFIDKGLNPFITTRTAAEKAEAESLGLDHVPSAPITAATGLLSELKHRLSSDVPGRPRDYFTFVSFN